MGDTSVSGLPELRHCGGGPILLDFSDAVDLDKANKTPSSTVDRKAHGSGDDATVSDLPEFRRNGGNPMDLDRSPCCRRLSDNTGKLSCDLT